MKAKGNHFMLKSSGIHLWCDALCLFGGPFYCMTSPAAREMSPDFIILFLYFVFFVTFFLKVAFPKPCLQMALLKLWFLNMLVLVGMGEGWGVILGISVDRRIVPFFQRFCVTKKLSIFLSSGLSRVLIWSNISYSLSSILQWGEIKWKWITIRIHWCGASSLRHIQYEEKS